MFRSLTFIGLIIISISCYCQDNELCLKVVKIGKKEFIITEGQRVKTHMLNQKGKLKNKKCRLLEINDSSFVIQPLYSSIKDSISMVVDATEFLGFKTKSSAILGPVGDVFSVILAVIPGNFPFLYIRGPFRVENFTNPKWSLQIAKLDKSQKINLRKATRVKLK